ncbi:unnamed protein product, partial [Iphiclides podalirius]
MESNMIEKLKAYGVGHRKLHDELFVGDKPPARLGVYDVDEENLCHEVIPTSCNVAGCAFKSDSLLEYENHYNASHRYSCGQCKKMLPSPHLLDLHLQERHDSFFAVLAAKKPSYCCYIEECKEKFMNADERLEHCVKIHKIPKDFRFDQKPKAAKCKNKNICDLPMELDVESSKQLNKFAFSNCKQKVFVKSMNLRKVNYKNNGSSTTNIDDVMLDLKESLPT